MAKKQRHTPEQIISKPRGAEVKLAKGTPTAELCKDLAVTEPTYYRWRKEHGGMKPDQAKRLEELEEDARLRRLSADAELDKAVLKEAASGKYRARRSGARRSSTCEPCSAPTAPRGAGPARSWGNAARRGGGRRRPPATSPGSSPGWLSWRRSTAVTGIAGWRPCCGPRGSGSITSGRSGSGAAKAWRCRDDSRSGAGCGRATARACGRGHAWSYDFVQARTRDGRAFRMLNVVDEFTRECPAIDVARRLTGDDVLGRLSDPFVRRGVPGHIRSDNGPEFTAKAVGGWAGRVGVGTLYIEPGSPWENGYVESFDGKLSDELLDGEVSDTLLGAEALIERHRVRHNAVRPRSSPGCRPPAPEAIASKRPALGASLLGPASMGGAVGAPT